MKIVIGDTPFQSKSSALAAIQTVLYGYEIGATVGADDAAFLADVLDRHPERDAKVGPGVASFQVEQNTGSRGFWLTRTDGSRTDWSVLACLTPPTHAQEVKAAFRTEIRDQVQTFRANAFEHGPVLCPITRRMLLLGGDAHVDHEPPFESIMQGFLVSRARSLEGIDVEPTRDRETETRLSDRALADAWWLYHQQHARLRIVSRLANLSLLRRGRAS